MFPLFEGSLVLHGDRTAQYASNFGSWDMSFAQKLYRDFMNASSHDTVFAPQFVSLLQHSPFIL